MKQQEPGKRMVSKGEYAFLHKQDAVRFSLMFCFGGIALACFLKLYGMSHIIAAINYPAASVAARADMTIVLHCSFIGILSSIIAAACWLSFKGDPLEPGGIEVKNLLTRANTADIPACDSLVRASEEPLQVQETVLLRAAMETTQGQEELLRSSAGEKA